ncbi:MAG: T9SS type A sorting domain-containing protein [bacterium]|nr:T9SS type A sorting domain-containing protein [bacterium]
MIKSIFLGFCVFAVTSLTAQINLSSSLTACYALNGNANDAINSLNGVLSSVTPTVDRFNTVNSAYHFNGTISSMIHLPNNPLLKPNVVSVSAWVRITAITGFMDIIFTKNIWSSFFTAYTLTLQDNGAGYKFRVYRQNGGGSDFVETSTTITAGTWYHVVFTIDNTDMRIYLNGVLENISLCSITSFSYDSAKDVILGGTDEIAVNNPFYGSLDNLRFYNRVINGAEAATLYTLDPVCVAPIGVPPVASFSSSIIQVCEGKSVTFFDQSSNTPTAWNWQVPGGATGNTTLSVITVTYNTPGVYTASLTSFNNFGASANTATQTIIVNPNPIVIAASSASAICIPGGTATLSASGATSFTWSSGQILGSFTVTPSNSSTYTVVGKDINGCVNSATVSIAVYPNPTVTAIASKTAVCAPGGPVTLTANGATTYLWSGGQTASSITVSPTTGTTYTVKGIDSKGCASSAIVTVNVLSCTEVTEHLASDFNITVFPNPSEGVFVISSREKTQAHVLITDVTGKVLLTKLIELGSDTKIDLINQPSGFYFLRIITSDTVTRLKIVKE